MKKWILAAVIAVAVLLAAYVIGGPYLAIRGISQAIEQRDTGKLARHVDFGAVRVNIKAQSSKSALSFTHQRQQMQITHQLAADTDDALSPPMYGGG